MHNLMSILESFQPGWKQRKFASDLVDILEQKIMPSYPFLEARIEGDRAQFSVEWDGILSDLQQAGIIDLFVPTQYGGRKTSEADIYGLMELLGYASPGLGVIFVSHGRAVDVILRGSRAQKEKYLPQMARGGFGAIAMTEEQAGSDAGAVGLMAQKSQGYFHLHGEKIFISNSGLAEVYTVLVNTKGIKGPRSLSVLIVPQGAPHMSVLDLPPKEGLKVLPTGRLVFEGCQVPSENLVGQEGRGLLLAMEVIDRGRIHLAGICCGLAYRIFRELQRHLHQRRQFDFPLTSSQDISFQITDMFNQMMAARALCFHALGQIGTPYYRLLSSQAKLFASQMVMAAANRAQVLMGGRGYFTGNLINQLAADARGMEYLEGTSNMQKMIISKELHRTYHARSGSGLF